MEYSKQIERWGVFEVTIPGKSGGNPFTDYEITANFTSGQEDLSVRGFYDGEGLYKVRFMPRFEGQYHFRVQGSFSPDVHEGDFLATPPARDNHGQVYTQGYHFAYADGTPYYPVGTTAYVWNLQDPALQEKTLSTLEEGYFNKIRFCVFPKHYLYNLHEPLSYPYEGTPSPVPESGDAGNPLENDWDFFRFNPQHFRHIEQCLASLMRLGIEADLILMHPYDRWGFSRMTPEQDDLYLHYVVARFAAFRNVWWSLANEYDLLRAKTTEDWERFASIIVREDPYQHLRSIHNCGPLYDHARPWITHCSIQRTDLYQCAEWTDQYRVRYRKPVILDEIAYEGDIDQGWGNISGQELVRRFWEASLRGGYATHGETYDRPDGILWWSHGGTLHGESPARIRFLHSILAQTPGQGLVRAAGAWDEVAATADPPGEGSYYLYYYGFCRPCKRTFRLSENVQYRVEIIDTWEMTLRDAGIHRGTFTLELPRKEYMAVRIVRV